MSDLFDELNKMPGGEVKQAPPPVGSSGKPASPAGKKSVQAIQDLGQLKGDALTHRVETCNPDQGLLQVIQDDEYLKPFEHDLKMR